MKSHPKEKLLNRIEQHLLLLDKKVYFYNTCIKYFKFVLIFVLDIYEIIQSQSFYLHSLSPCRLPSLRIVQI